MDPVHGNVVSAMMQVETPKATGTATVAYSPAGAQLWANAYTGPDLGLTFPGAVAIDPQGMRVLVAGATESAQSTATGREMYVQAFSST